MAALLIISLAAIALAARAGIFRSAWSAAGSGRADDVGVFDACARALVLVLVSLLGLFALGVMYGDVLSSGDAVLSTVR